MYIAMEEVHDYKHWMKLATVSCDYAVCMNASLIYLYNTLQCFHLWDLDARGFHKVSNCNYYCIEYRIA